MTTALILPGIGNSGPEHWQSIWENKHPSFVRIKQHDWDRPTCSDWVASLENTLADIDADVVLVAHSLGCLLAAHWTKQTALHAKVKGALLVAPPNPDGPNFPKEAVGFSPLPRRPFPFPSILVASSNDPYASIEFAASLSSDWGSQFVSIGAAGHINASSGLGEWPQGFALLMQLMTIA